MYWDVASVTLSRTLIAELDLFPAKSLIGTEMFPIEECEGEVDVDSHALGGIPPYEVNAEDFFCARECDGPFLVAVDKLLGGHVSMEVSRHGLGDHEGEDVGVPSVWELRESVEEGHGLGLMLPFPSSSSRTQDIRLGHASSVGIRQGPSTT